jgi:hypothetical protein
MVSNYSIIICAITVLACGKVTSDQDAGLDASHVGCTISACSGSIDLPVGATIAGDDMCFWKCPQANTPTCDLNATCGHCGAPTAPENLCDGGLGPYGSPQPSCSVPTCGGQVNLPFRALIISDDGCLYSCGADAEASCGPYNNQPCVCGQLACDGDQ